MCRKLACLLACFAGRLSLTLHPPRVGAHEAKAGFKHPVFVLLPLKRAAGVDEFISAPRAMRKTESLSHKRKRSGGKAGFKHPVFVCIDFYSINVL